ncbi:hypothetical protein RFI_38489 [Reticulomyxa filosa]|uniref:Uncharacterized protein n=1 Tax=Reticulomyxa filosa TaxID=46433 RepID=X6LE38_RETFI|nr:hypothetical protein RFI_38489 [Reticulomyxa filosa]|eukprot:ETN98999.1 hypothetical protein RFI_38489 [Reticulomyxa filosa]
MALYSAALTGAKLADSVTETTPLRQDDSSSEKGWDSEDETLEKAGSAWCWCLKCCTVSYLSRLVIPLYSLIMLVSMALLLLKTIGMSGAMTMQLFYVVLGATLFGGVVGMIGEVLWANLLNSLNREGTQYKESNNFLSERIVDLKSQIDELTGCNIQLEDERKHFRTQVNKFDDLKHQIRKLLEREEGTDSFAHLQTMDLDVRIEHPHMCNEDGVISKFNHLVAFIEETEKSEYLEMFYEVTIARHSIQSKRVFNPNLPCLLRMDSDAFHHFLHRLPKKNFKKFQHIATHLDLFHDGRDIGADDFLRAVDVFLRETRVVKEKIYQQMQPTTL